MGDAGQRRGVVRLWPAEAATRHETALARAGWATGDELADLDIVDLSGAPDEAMARLRVLADAHRPVLALFSDPSDAGPAVEAGATHLHLLGGAIELRDSLSAAARLVPARERRSGDGALGQWLAQRQGDSQTLIRVQLLRLDLVNAAHGRDMGTSLVAAAERRVASVLEALADEDDTALMRVPGPGFVAAVAGPVDLAIVAAARIEEALDRPFRLEGTAVTLGARIALAGSRPDDDPAALVARAERALGDTGGEANDELEELALDLHRGMSEGQVTLVFQPQASLETGRVTGVEALARWQHPRLGALGAERLFAAAQQGGIALALSDHIQRLVLAQIAAWPPELSRLSVSLNLTPADLDRPRFAETFLDHVDALGLPHGRLTVEITETGLMADLTAAAALLATLRAAGCRVAIDDFGTGYSSLAWLKSLPVDYLKLDKSLAQDIAGTERDRVVVRGAIDMARSLGLSVVAEGVETEEQRALLAEEGCAIYQGFLLAEPMDELSLAAWIAGR